MEWIWGSILKTPFRRTCGSPGSLVAAGNCIGQAVSFLTRLSSSLIFPPLLSLSQPDMLICLLVIFRQHIWWQRLPHSSVSLNSIVLSSIPSILLSEVHPSQLPSCWFLCCFSSQLGKSVDHFMKSSFPVGNIRSYSFSDCLNQYERGLQTLAVCLPSLKHMKG